jgi:hypothetical protein
MDQQDFLIGFAQISLVLTGFVSFFVVFLIDRSEKSAVNTLHAASILIGSVLTLIATFIPLILFQYGVFGEKLWWWSSFFHSIIGSVYLFVMLSLTIPLTKKQYREAGYIHLVTSYSLGTTAGVFNVLNLIGPSIPGHFILALVIGFLIPLMTFVTFSAHEVFHWNES